MNNIENSGKTLQAIERIIQYHKDNPHGVIYASSQELKERLLELMPDANIKVAEMNNK